MQCRSANPDSKKLWGVSVPAVFCLSAVKTTQEEHTQRAAAAGADTGYPLTPRLVQQRQIAWVPESKIRPVAVSIPDSTQVPVVCWRTGSFSPVS